MTKRPDHVHGTAVAVAVDADGPLAGALLLGPPGSGKSALAIALIEGCPFRRTGLIADDVVVVERCGETVEASALARAEGLIEARGFGPARIRAAPKTRLVAAFDLAGPAGRLCAGRKAKLGACATIDCWPLSLENTTPERLRLILRAILCGQSP